MREKINELVKEEIDKLNVSISDVNIEKVEGKNVLNIELDCEETPIYHSVFKALNLNFERKLLHSSYIRNNPFNNITAVKTVEGYIKDYVLWNYGYHIR